MLDHMGVHSSFWQVDSIKRNKGQAQAVYCDTSQYSNQQAMFKAHAEAYGSLDVTMLNAGILERGEQVPAQASWLQILVPH